MQATGGVDQDRLAEHMHGTTFRTTYGDIAFGPDGEWKAPRMLTVQFRGLQGQGMDQFRRPGSHVILHPAEYRTGGLGYPFGS